MRQPVSTLLQGRFEGTTSHVIWFSKSLPRRTEILDGRHIAEPAQPSSRLRLGLGNGGEDQAVNDSFGYSRFVNAGVSASRAAS